MQIRALFFLLSITLAGMGINSCVKERFETGGGKGVTFSVDTLRFDTVFTSLGSATRSVKVYNPHSLPIIIDEITLREGEASSFRFNADGFEGPSAKGVEIGGNDSTYIFVEVTIDPDQPLSESPFILGEELIVRVNGTEQVLRLEAWGQNANYIPSRFGKNGVAILTCNFNTVVWDDPKPYVIYGVLVVDECTLELPPGARVYVHGGIAINQDDQGMITFYNDGLIFVGPNGRLNSNGTLEDPVIIQGDRLEPLFETTPGQWQGIRLGKTSKGNSFSHTTIKNSLFGIFVDSLAEVQLDASIIANTSSDGILAFHGTVRAQNSLFYNNGRNSFGAILGGDYTFTYCTLANFRNNELAVGMSGSYCYDFPECNVTVTNAIKARFTNCVMTGSNSDEFWVSFPEGEQNELLLENCVFRVNELIKPNNLPDFVGDYTLNSINRQRSDSLFADLSADDYRPDTLSVLEHRAKPIAGITNDLEGNERDPVSPDVGCYEYQYE
jgi:hypothetical protein